MGARSVPGVGPLGFALVAVAIVALVSVARAAEKRTEEEEKLARAAATLNRKAVLLYRSGKVADAVLLLEQALALCQRLYPVARCPDGHPDLATSLNNLGFMLQMRGQLVKAQPYLEQALAMRRKLNPAARFPDGHPDLAESLTNLGFLLQARGKLATAQPYLEQALAMYQKLYPAARFPGGHPHLATSLNNLGALLRAGGELVKAQVYLEQALAMRRKLYPAARFPGGHPDLALSLNNLGNLLQARGELVKAQPYYEQVLAMYQRLYPAAHFPDGHPNLAGTLTNLGSLLQARGELVKAQSYLEQALAMCQRLYPAARFPNGHFFLAGSLNRLGLLLQARGELVKAQPYLEQALAMCQRRYPAARFPAGHPHLATSLNNLGALLYARGELAKAQPYLEQGLAMCQKLYPAARFPNGHPELARSFNNLGALLKARGELATAQPYCEQALAMKRKLYPAARFPAGHPELAMSLNNLGILLKGRGELVKAQPYYKQALAMRQRLYPAARFPDGHPDLAASLTNLGNLLHARGELATAQPYLEQALAMYQKLYPVARFPVGHPDLATSLNNLGNLLKARGKLVKAQSYYEQALTLRRNLYPAIRFPDGHPDLATSLINLGGLLEARGESAKAQPYCEKALAMYQKLTEAFADLSAEADALNFTAALPAARNGYLSLTADRPDHDPRRVHTHLWQTKGILLRVLTHRRRLLHDTTDANTRRLLHRYLDTRRELARLVLTPTAPGTAGRHALDDCTRRKEDLERQLAAALTEVKRLAGRNAPTHDALLKALPADGAFLDLFRYGVWDAKGGKWAGHRYAAFVLRRDQPVRRVELGDAKTLEDALKRWRDPLLAQGRDADTPSARATAAAADRASAAMRRLVWQPLAAHLGEARRVWICPDGPLSALPFAALPGRRPGTVLLEEHAVAVVPHGPALLDWLTHPAAVRDGTRLLLLGGIAYGTPDKPWPDLPGTRRERDEIRALARTLVKGATVAEVGGTDADAARVLGELRQARWAHLATHGYFAAPDSTERERLYARADFLRMAWGERIGSAQRNPLTLTGLVLAGANHAKSKDDKLAGILTAEALASEDLRGLELAVLSACQTGLGESEDEGVFGLQRALHQGGCRNVVASLWRVPDDATAALMAVFYRKLWQEKLPPVEALRQAQLALYRHPASVPRLAKARGPDFDTEYKRVSAPRPETTKPAAGGRLPPRFWAGFVLSGPGR